VYVRPFPNTGGGRPGEEDRGHAPATELTLDGVTGPQAGFELLAQIGQRILKEGGAEIYVGTERCGMGSG
jgi:hypothetical protein